jgi:pimeloyl-ACP methyl ester carboxylesterase
MTAFVLVHGGWHGGWCWRRLLPLLRAGDREVHAPTLTGLGDRAHLAAPGVGLATHIEDVVALLAMEDLRDVVLVGHSSGGVVITGVAQRAPDRIAELVYLDAFVPEPGQSLLDLLPAPRREFFLSQVEAGMVVLAWEAAMDGWAVRDESDRAWLRERLRPHPVGGLADPLPPDPVPGLPRRFVHCTDKPVADSFAGFAAAAREDSAWRFHELDAGHDAMITAPDRLCGVLIGDVFR